MPFLAALATMVLVTLIGVVFWFRPVAEADTAGTPLTSPAVGRRVSSRKRV